MQVKTQTKLYTTIITPAGRLDQAGAVELESHLKAINPLTKEVVLDAAQLSYISSMGLRVILQTYKNLHKLRKTFKIINMTENIRSIFKMSGFIQAFVEDEHFIMIETECRPPEVVYSVAGTLEADAEGPLHDIALKLKERGINKIRLVCSGVVSINDDGCKVMTGFHDVIVRNGARLFMEQVPDAAAEKLKAHDEKFFAGVIAAPHNSV